jgi:hypothetical protein
LITQSVAWRIARLVSGDCLHKIGFMQSDAPVGRQSQGNVTTDDQSVIPSWCRAPSGAHDQILASVTTVTALWLWGVLSDNRAGPVMSQGDGQLHVNYIYTFIRIVHGGILCYIQYIQRIQGLCKSTQRTADYALAYIAHATTSA